MSIDYVSSIIQQPVALLDFLGHVFIGNKTRSGEILRYETKEKPE